MRGAARRRWEERTVSVNICERGLIISTFAKAKRGDWSWWSIRGVLGKSKMREKLGDWLIRFSRTSTRNVIAFYRSSIVDDYRWCSFKGCRRLSPAASRFAIACRVPIAISRGSRLSRITRLTAQKSHVTRSRLKTLNIRWDGRGCVNGNSCVRMQDCLSKSKTVSNSNVNRRS